MNPIVFKLSLVLMGLSGISGQILLLRELLISFSGNELTIGIILANWLVIEAIGSYWVGRTVEKTTKRLEIYGLLQLIFSVAFPMALYLSRIFKNFIVPYPGEGLGPVSVLYASFLVLLPVSLPHGALFTYGCKLLVEHSQEPSSSIGKVYALETLGTLLGGVLITFFLVQYLNPFQIVFILALANALMTLLLLWPGAVSASRLQKGFWCASLALSILFGYLLVSSRSDEMHRSSLGARWRGMEIVHEENSAYGNITLTQRGGQYTFFAGGAPSITTPVPDLASMEDLVHFSFLFHENPKSVLILHGGAGGMIHEILKHPVNRVDYVELDPRLLKLLREFPTPLTQSELSDKRVFVHQEDSRVFVKTTPLQYDLIMVGLSAPQELQSNRLFTSEFFSEAKQKLTRDGILTLTLPGSTTYLSSQLQELNGCIWDTLKAVYRYVTVIPGDVNLYLASNSGRLSMVNADEIVKRFEKRKIDAGLFTEGYIRDRLQESRRQWFLQSLKETRGSINSDLRPLAVFHHLSYWNALFSPYLAAGFKRIEGFSLRSVLLLIAALTLSIAVLFIKRPSVSGHAVTYSIFSSGLAAIILELAIIFAFQTLYGSLYQQIGLLVATFMAGAASGSLWMTQTMKGMKNNRLSFLKTEACIVVFSVLLPCFFLIPSRLAQTSGIVLHISFLFVSFIAGGLIGLQFPLAAMIYLRVASKKGGLSETAGALYGADLLGGFLGGLLGGTFLLPVLGLKECCFAVGMIKASSLLLFLLSSKMKRLAHPSG